MAKAIQRIPCSQAMSSMRPALRRIFVYRTHNTYYLLLNCGMRCLSPILYFLTSRRQESRTQSQEAKELMTIAFHLLSLLPRCLLLRASSMQHTWHQVVDSGPPITCYGICVCTLCEISFAHGQFCAATCMYAPICLKIPEPANPKIENGGGLLQKP